MDPLLHALVSIVAKSVKDSDSGFRLIQSFGFDDNPNVAKVIFDLGDDTTAYITIEVENA